MRPTHIVWALALCAVAACRDGRHASAPTLPRPNVTPEPPRAPGPATPLEGSAAALSHPNDDVDGELLGARVTARPLPLPEVALGQSARFTFHGQRRGWVLKLAGEALATPAYARGKVYVGAGFHSTRVYALDAHTGALSWMADTPDGGPTAAIVEDDRVLFNTESCTLFAFDARTGRQRWSHYLGDPLMSQPAAARGRVFSAYPADGGFAFSAMSMRDGRYLWTREVPADVLTAPVIVGNAVYATTMDGTVFKFRASDGGVVWRRALEATSAPAVDGDRVYLARRAPRGMERQAVLSTVDGRVLSSTTPVRAPYARQRADVGGVEAGWGYEGARPTYADGRLYHAMGDEVVARDAASGRVVWRRRYGGSVARRGLTSPAVVGSQLVVGTRDGDVFGMDIDTGSTTWAYRVGEPITFQPAVANGWVYLTTARGKVIGLEVADASLDGWHMWGGNAVHNGSSAHEALPDTDDRPGQGTLRAQGRDGQALPLLHTSVRAEITGVIARVTVEQTFQNTHTQPIDAEYLFPLPAEAAVDAMDMHVGQRVIHGEIQRRAEARQTYERARTRGRTAALLEQERPNLFRQSVANIPPGQSLRVVLRFAETVAWRDGRYEFVMPMSAGSRYTPGVGGVTPERPPGDVDLSASVDLGVALDGVASPTHPVAVTMEGDRARVSLAAGRAMPDRDFVLRYKPRIATVTPTLLARRDGDDGFFTLTLHPDVNAPDADIAPRELVFVVDTSSSMRGAPIENAKALLRRAFERLRPTDTFRVVRFSDEAAELATTPLAPSPDNLARARAWVDGLQAAGATEMLPGLRAALAGSPSGDRLRVVVLVTDGYIGNERQVLAEVQRTLGAARVFSFGVGTAVNRYLLEQVAEVGRGVAEVVTPREDARVAAERFYAHIDRPYLTDVAVDFGGVAVSGVYPRAIPDVFADHAVTLQGRYARGGDAQVRVTGRIRGRPWSQTLRVRLPERAQDHEALPTVWARARIKDLSRAMLLGELPALREEVTTLGLRFGIVTDYTSFVAVDEGAAIGAARGSVPATAFSGGATGSAFGYGGLGMSGVGWGGSGGSVGSIGVGRMGVFGALGGGEVGSVVAARAFVARVTVGPSVRASPPVVTGSMSAEVIRRVVLRNLAQVRSAYERSLRNDPNRAGRVVVRFVIGTDGNVIAATVVENTTSDPEVGFAIALAARSWVFPALEGSTVVVNYPFNFEPPTTPSDDAANAPAPGSQADAAE